MLTFKKHSARASLQQTNKGDTLVEVALAIGILGFVVAATVVTMNATLSASQSNLESTMARNEIDVQAEAIRYIHNAYVAQRDLTQSDQEYSLLWQAMLAQAVEPSAIPELADITSCSEFYTSGNSRNLYNSNAFIVNTHRLNVQDAKNSSLTDNIIVKSRNNTTFQPASLFPRILYGAADDTMSSEANYTLGNHIYRAEGIWVQVACGNNFSNCTSQGSGSKPDYYDFYIRTCWESADSPVPNTIGTIVRLYNPDLDSAAINQQHQFRVNYYVSNDPSAVYTDSAWDYTTHSFTVNSPATAYRSNSDGWSFVGWCVNYNNTNPHNTCSDLSSLYNVGDTLTASIGHNNGTVNLVAVYAKDYRVNYASNVSGTSNLPAAQTGSCRTISITGSSCRVNVLPTTSPTRSGITFSHWADSGGTVYNNSNPYYTFSGSSLRLTLTAYWKNLYRIIYNANSGGDSVSNMPSSPSASTNCNTTCSVQIDTKLPLRSGHVFLGWSLNSSATTTDSDYAPGNTVTISSDITLYAVWQTATNDEWAIMASWSGGCQDIDSHTYIYNGSTQLGHIYYSNPTGTFNGTKVSLDHDYTSPGNTETTTIDNLYTSGNTIYFCVRCYSGSTNFASGNPKVVVTSPGLNLYNTYTASSSSSSRDWAVVKIEGTSVSVRDSLSCDPVW